ncbi:MAG: arginine--tRNA ligase [Pseudomonadales bacterium]|nr:arginine--tRNA ligase [Pseudomonadales bacterium]
MLTIRQTLENLLSSVIADISGIADSPALVIPSSRQEFGDYQANGVMSLAKRMACKPRDLAQRIVSAIPAHPLLAKAEVAGPGFINLFLAEAELCDRLLALSEKPENLVVRTTTPKRIVVDYSSPNLAKEMHVGHLRGTIIGDCLARVLEASGHSVIRQNHVGDWGTQFGMLIAHMESLQQEGADPGASLSDLELFYRQAKQRFDLDQDFATTARQYVVKLQQGDKRCLEIWQHFINESLHHCEEIYKLLNVNLQRKDLRPESFYNDELPKVVALLAEKNLLQESEGAKCVFAEGFTGKDGSPLPTIVQKQDGGYLYATTDLAAVAFRCTQLSAERILYVVDARQSLHFQQLFAIARMAQLAGPECSLEHIAYGTMMGADGRPFKTRSGDTVKLKELLEESIRRAHALLTEKNSVLDEASRAVVAEKVGIAAVKYSDLAKNRTSDYVFDWNSMLSFEGNTAPYMLYAYARIRSILRKARVQAGASDAILLQAQEERQLAVKLLQFSEAVHAVATECYPNYLCQYLYELAGLFMRFYENCPILKTEDKQIRNSRLKLADLTAKTLQQGLDLLGIETLEQM